MMRSDLVVSSPSLTSTRKTNTPTWSTRKLTWAVVAPTSSVVLAGGLDSRAQR